MSPRSSGPLLVVSLLAIAACSGGESSSVDTTQPAAATTAPATAPPTTVAPTTVPVTTAPPTTDPADRYADWCAITIEARETFGDDVDLTDPEQVREYIEGLTALAEQATEVVPDEIADAWAVSLEVSRLSREAIEAADYDMLVADFSALAELEEDEAASEAAIDAFNEEWCGLEPDPDDDDDFDPALGSLRDQFILALTDAGFTEDEAVCVFDNYDFAATDTIGEDDAIGAALVACGISPERLLEVSSERDPDGFDEAVDGLVAIGLTDDQVDCVLQDWIALEIDPYAEGPPADAFERCGVDPRTVVAAGLGPLLADEGLSDDEIDCVIDELDIEAPDREATLLAALDACGIDPARLANFRFP